MDLLEPRLYAPAGEADFALLRALREPESGALTFPPSTYGCTTTGRPAEALEEVTLSGHATLLTCITIHQPVLPGLAPPMLVARLRLAEGPVVQGLVDGLDEAALPPGTKMRAVLVPAEGGLACHFRKVPA